MHYILILVLLMLLFSIFQWLAVSSIVEKIASLFISIVFIVLIQSIIFILSYLYRKLSIENQKEIILAKFESFENATTITKLISGFFCIFGFFLTLKWGMDYEESLILQQPLRMIIVGFFIFLLIELLLYVLLSPEHNDPKYGGKPLNFLNNPFKDKAHEIQKKINEEDKKRTLINNLKAFKQKSTDWKKENEKEIKWILKEAKKLDKSINKRTKHLLRLVNDYYFIPRCKQCNTNKQHLIDINDSTTGIQLMCKKCGKKTWFHSNQDNIEDGNLYKQYFDEYFSLYQEGYQLRESFDNIDEKHGDELFDKWLILEKNAYYEKIVRKEEKNLNPHKYLLLELLEKINDATMMFFRSDEDIASNKLNYIILDSTERKKIEEKTNRPPIPQKVKDLVWNRDGGKCISCGSNENIEFDHIIPISKGGPSTYKNLQILCQNCNRSKSNKIG